MTIRGNAVKNPDKRRHLFVFCPFSLEEKEPKESSKKWLRLFGLAHAGQRFKCT
jgi:hypothetical protein